MKNTLLNTALVTILTLGVHLGNHIKDTLAHEEYDVLHSRATTLRDLENACASKRQAALFRKTSNQQREASTTEQQSVIDTFSAVLSSPESTLEMLVPATLNLRDLGVDWRTMAEKIAQSHSETRGALLTELSNVFKQLATTLQDSDKASAADYAKGAQEMRLETTPYIRLKSDIELLIAHLKQKNEQADDIQASLNEGHLSRKTTRPTNRILGMEEWTKDVLKKPFFDLKELISYKTEKPRVQGDQLKEVEEMEKLDRTSAKLLYIKFALEDLANEFDELIAAGQAKLDETVDAA